MTDTKSPSSEELHSLHSLKIHFYRPNTRTPLWQKALWRPKFAHCCVEWRNMIHDLPYDRAAEVYEAKEFLEDAPSHLTIVIPHGLSLLEEVALVPDIHERYEGRRVDKWGVVRWYLGKQNKKPWSCATLVSLWLKLFLGWPIDAVTPDELYSELLPYITDPAERTYAV